MTEPRPLLLVFLTFAVALGALGVAAGSAAVRCDDPGDCSFELSLAVFAFAPGALIGVLVLLLLRSQAELPWLRSLFLAGGVGVATIPLAAFLLQDAVLIAVAALLVAALVLLVLIGERLVASAALATATLLFVGTVALLVAWGLLSLWQGRELWDILLLPAAIALLIALVVLAVFGEHEIEPIEPWLGADAAPSGEEASPSYRGRLGPRPAPRPRVAGTLALLEQLADLNSEIIRLCEALPRGHPR